MNRLYALLLLTLAAITSFAVPAKRGQWRMLTLADGREVRAELVGDEHVRFWRDAAGTCYVADTLTARFRVADANELSALSMARRRIPGTAMRRMSAIRRAAADDGLFTGQKRGLIILVDFPNQRFSMSAPKALFDSIANTRGYSEHGFQGSIGDYFRAQSGGKFQLDFDVVGPVTMPQNYSYYGDNGERNAPEMVRDACLAVDSLVDFAHYDWDGDGEVEEVFVLYAGHGQADYDSSDDNLIWPHMYYLTSRSISLRLDGKVIDTYACSCELNGYSDIAGIGTFCHEFSHCMGFPDMYDTNANRGGTNLNYGMGPWDLMDYGSYNGNGYSPAGYTGYEKMVCGWTTPVELTADTVITGVRPMADMGQSYIIRNPAHGDEYYVLENRQRKGFDRGLPGHGLLITHIDYNKRVWDYNAVNTTSGSYGFINDHPRIAVFHADNARVNSRVPYPYNGNDSLTDNSTPSAMLYNGNTDGTMLMHRSVTAITEHADSTVSFVFTLTKGTGDDPVVVPTDGVLFSETFDQCNGKGGNDGVFSGMVGNGAFTPDNEGWGELFSHVYGASQCAKFGTSSAAAFASSPSITFPGDTATVSFRCAGWDGSSDGTSLLLQLSNPTVKFVASGSTEQSLTMDKGAWKTFTLKVVGKGKASINFQPGKRFFLDDVLVTVGQAATGIRRVRTDSPAADADAPRYNLQGQRVGRGYRGIVIQNGKKMVVR